MNIFGSSQPKLTPAEQAKQWKRNIAKEVRSIERDIDKLRREEKKSLQECKKLLKDGHNNAAKMLAKEVVNVRKSIERMHTAKAQMNSVSMNLQTTASMMKMQECVSKSAEIMTMMNNLVKLPELRQTMTTMSKEMMKAGLIDELIGDTLDDMDGEGIDSVADSMVDQIMTELTSDILSNAGPTPMGKVKKAGGAAEEKVQEEDDSEEMKKMQERLASL